MSFPSATPAWLKTLAPYIGLVGLNVLFRFPVLLNAGGVHSDAAIVGLQAMHVLHGEFSRFLWGVGHQAALDAWVAAACFVVGGPTPLMLMMAPFIGHLVLTGVLFAFLCRLLPSRAAAFITCLPLVFTTVAVNDVVMYAPRQWSVTIALCGAMIVAWPSRPTPLRLAIGVALSLMAVYVDLISLVWLPALSLLTVWACLDPPRDAKIIARRLGGAAAGAGVAIAAVVALRTGVPSGSLSFTLALFHRNWPMARDTGLPMLFGAKVWIPGGNLYPDLWTPPTWVAGLQWTGAASIIVLAIASVVLAFSSRVRGDVRRVVAFGAAAAVTVLSAFVLSRRPIDMWSTRYLTPMVWSLPFGLVALARLMRPRVFALLLAPYLAVAAVAGWLSYGSYVHGAVPRLDARGAIAEEMELAQFLRARGYEYGYAQYWLAYRLTFLWREHPTIAPFSSDRYPPYAEAVDRAKKKAYIFHPSEPRAPQPGPVFADLRRHGERPEMVQVAGFTVILSEER